MIIRMGHRPELQLQLNHLKTSLSREKMPVANGDDVVASHFFTPSLAFKRNLPPLPFHNISDIFSKDFTFEMN